MAAISASDVIGLALASPLCVSVVMSGWAMFWDSNYQSPLPTGLHKLLLLAEAAVVIVLVFPVGVQFQFAAASATYLGLAAGAAVLLRRRGAVPCGCWGPTGHVLSWRLVVANALGGLIAFSQLWGHRSVGAGGAALLGVSLVALSFVFGVALPEMRRALTGVRGRADGERRWFQGFPDLERM